MVVNFLSTYRLYQSHHHHHYRVLLLRRIDNISLPLYIIISFPLLMVVMNQQHSSVGSNRSNGNFYDGGGYQYSYQYDGFDNNKNCSSNDNIMDRHGKKKSMTSSVHVKTILKLIVFAGTVIYAVQKQVSFRRNLSNLSKKTAEYQDLYDKYVDKLTALRSVYDNFTSLNLRLNAIVPNDDEKSDVTSSQDSQRIANTFIGRNDAQNERIDSLKLAIQDKDRKALQSKYGDGPYNVEVTVLVEGQRRFFTIQTAPNDLVPHSIRRFLEMVEAKAWDGTLLYHQVDDVVMAAPVDVNGQRKKLPSLRPLSFPEYSKDIPNKKYTVGFHKGGPEIFINTMDKSQSRAPVESEGQACFGIITHGKDIIETFRELNRKGSKMESGVYFSKIERLQIDVK